MSIGPVEMTVVAAEEEQLTLRSPLTPALHQPFGLLHGGVSMLMAESAASMHAMWGVDPVEKVPLGIEINGSHLRSASDGHVLAVATVLRRSRSLIVHQVQIIHEESGRLLSQIRVTNFYKFIR